MTPLNTIIEEEKKGFETEFNRKYGFGVWDSRAKEGHRDEGIYSSNVLEHSKRAITTAMQRAYEAGGREAVNYIRNTFKDESEIGVNHLNVELDTLLSKIRS